MKVLFLTLIEINSISERGIYQDLLRKFVNEGHDVTVVSPKERRKKVNTNLKVDGKVKLLQVKTFNIQKTNIVEKGIGTLAIEYQYLRAIKKHLSNFTFDLVLYSTPPITFFKVIDFIKKRDNAFTYLLLKDIFPQNAVDMKMLKKEGMLHKFFLGKEKRLYDVSDVIGCMSSANVSFLLKNNPHIKSDKVEVNPNSIEPYVFNYTDEQKNDIREKYNLPLNQKIFIYGGNLGKPQGLDFLLKTIDNSKNPKAHFLIVGSGTEYNRILKWFRDKKPNNATLIEALPKQDYDLLLNACDVGMIFLHKDFTIPNFPSRLLSYLEMKLPVIAATDSSSDVGDVIEKNNCGYKIMSGDTLHMQETIDEMCFNENKYNQMKENSFQLLMKEFTIDYSYQIIKKRIENR